MAKLAEGGLRDLANDISGNLKLAADLFERLGRSAGKSETLDEHALFAVGEGFKRLAQAFPGNRIKKPAAISQQVRLSYRVVHFLSP